MQKKTRRKFTKEQRDKAVDDYVSGARTAKQIAADLNTDIQSIYRWKTTRDEKAKGLRVEQLMEEGMGKIAAERLLEKELEIEAYQKKVAELTIINDLLKKLQTPEDLVLESELTGLIKTINKSGRKNKRQKR